MPVYHYLPSMKRKGILLLPLDGLQAHRRVPSMRRIRLLLLFLDRMPVHHSTAIKRLGQFFALFREISFTMRWKNKQGYIYIIADQSLLSVNLLSSFPHKRVSLLLNVLHSDKLALTNGVNKYEIAHFQVLRTFLVNFQKS